MKKTYLSVGTDYTDTDEKKAALDLAIEGIRWFGAKQKNELPFMQGFALKEMLKAFGHKVSDYGYGCFDDGLQLYGMVNHYGKGDVVKAIMYAIDDGCDIVTPVLAVTFTREELEQEKKDAMDDQRAATFNLN